MIPKSTIIAFLIFMAVLLTCVLALQQFNYIGTSAQADTNRAGRYVVATTLFDESRSLFWLCNVDNQTLTAFSFLDTGGFTAMDSVNLNFIFRPIMNNFNPNMTPQQIREMQNRRQGANPPEIRPPGQVLDPNRIR